MPMEFTWELVVPYKNKEWKFDVWYLKPSEKYVNLVHDSINRFETELLKHPEKRTTILEIKEAYFDGVKYRNNLTGFDIYSAVLEKGVSSIEDFVILLKD